jgi:hypothetical protein
MVPVHKLKTFSYSSNTNETTFDMILHKLKIIINLMAQDSAEQISYSRRSTMFCLFV